jgi:hypothetical protein
MTRDTPPTGPQGPLEQTVPGGVPIKMWTRGVPVEDDARRQLRPLRSAIEAAVPHGYTPRRSGRDRGAWQDTPPETDAA